MGAKSHWNFKVETDRILSIVLSKPTLYYLKA